MGSAQALYFLIGFLIVLGLYIYFIRFMALRLGGKVAYKSYNTIERVIIGGIVAGVIAMFQPWIFAAFRVGFILLLFSTLAFIVWSHVTPAPAPLEEQVLPAAADG